MAYGNNSYRRIRQLSPVNTAIVAANIIVFVIMEIIGNTNDTLFMLEHGGGFAPFIIDGHEYWRLITSMFLHFGIRHIFNNMLVLAFIGDNLERAVGKFKYIVIYFGSGIVANIVSTLIEYNSGRLVLSAGASGAIFGVVGALIYVLIVNRGQLEDLNIMQILLFAAMSIYLGLQDSHTDNIAHIAGLIAGLSLAIILYRKKKN